MGENGGPVIYFHFCFLFAFYFTSFPPFWESFSPQAHHRHHFLPRSRFFTFVAVAGRGGDAFSRRRRPVRFRNIGFAAIL